MFRSSNNKQNRTHTLKEAACKCPQSTVATQELKCSFIYSLLMSECVSVLLSSILNSRTVLTALVAKSKQCADRMRSSPKWRRDR